MTYHTGRAYGTDGATAVQYRHIENPWGNVFDWVDGVNFNGSTVYVCTDPAKYADDTSDGYTNAGTRASSSGYISALGASTTAPWAIYPSSAGGSRDHPTSRTTRGLRAAGLCCMWAATGTTARMPGPVLLQRQQQLVQLEQQHRRSTPFSSPHFAQGLPHHMVEIFATGRSLVDLYGSERQRS